MPELSDLQRHVLLTVRAEVPYGETATYGEVAELAGRPGAARAVGTAMSRNPVPFFVPCHRVVAANGIGGYGGGRAGHRAQACVAGSGSVAVGPAGDDVDEPRRQLELRCVPAVGQLDVAPVVAPVGHRACERDRDQPVAPSVHHERRGPDRVEVGPHARA